MLLSHSLLFLLWLFGMFLPFALFGGLVDKLRPGLMPYFAYLHALLDLATWTNYLILLKKSGPWMT
jgi:hypothetical protein